MLDARRRRRGARRRLRPARAPARGGGRAPARDPGRVDRRPRHGDGRRGARRLHDGARPACTGPASCTASTACRSRCAPCSSPTRPSDEEVLRRSPSASRGAGGDRHDAAHHGRPRLRPGQRRGRRGARRLPARRQGRRRRPEHATRIDARGMVVMPGGVDIHAHIAGPKVNAARRLAPEEHRGGRPGAHRDHALGHRRHGAVDIRHRLPLRAARLHDGRRGGGAAARRAPRPVASCATRR